MKSHTHTHTHTHTHKEIWKMKMVGPLTSYQGRLVGSLVVSGVTCIPNSQVVPLFYLFNHSQRDVRGSEGVVDPERSVVAS